MKFKISFKIHHKIELKILFNKLTSFDSINLHDFKWTDCNLQKFTIKKYSSIYIIHIKSHSNNFSSLLTELYKLTGEILGEGAYASVQTCINLFTDVECAVKIIDKIPGHARARVFREVETFHHCHGHPNILQLIEFFEDKEKFYLVFEKINGGPLLTRIQENICFSEHDAAQIIKEIASGLNFLHKKGIAHRDLKVSFN